jgi:hypothetical protein
VRAISRVAVVATGSTVFVFVGGASVWSATSGDSRPDTRESPVSREDLDRAGRAALHATGGTRVSESDVGDEDSYYEVEVVLDDGLQVDVQLDASFSVVGITADADLFGPD